MVRPSASRFLLIATACLWGAGATGQPAPVAADSPRLQAERTASRLTLQGDVSSTAHEVILRQTIREQFPGLPADIGVVVRNGTPPGWSLLTDLAVRALAETSSGMLDIDAERVLVRAMTADAGRVTASLARVEKALLPGMRLERDIIEIPRDGSFADLCRARLAAAQAGRQVEFPNAGAALGPGAEPLLDALVEIVADCAPARLRVTGHTDASGDEAANRTLSLARAQAVVDYLRAAGLPADRLEAAGAGSSDPLVDAADARSRRINRRVEFELLAP